jgi:hypothetical protein
MIYYGSITETFSAQSVKILKELHEANLIAGKTAGQKFYIRTREL